MRLMHFAIFALALASLAAGAAPASACSCMAMSEGLALKRSALAFEGVAEETRKAEGADTSEIAAPALVTTFRVLRTLKGEDLGTREIHHYHGNGANCGYDFEIGQTYRVYAHETDEGFATNSCSMTHPIESEPEED